LDVFVFFYENSNKSLCSFENAIETMCATDRNRVNRYAILKFSFLEFL